MSSSRCAVRGPPEPVRAPLAELAPSPGRVRRLGRLRLPLSLRQRPWATAYRLPDGRTIWCVRLCRNGEVVRSVVSTATLRAYARRSGLVGLADAVDAVVGPEVPE
jgi:hypothetical protein